MKQFSLEEYLKNPDRKVVTRGGLPVRIVCTDKVCNKKVSQKPIIALVDFGDIEVVYPYSSDGISSPSLPEFDLFFATEKKTGWVNIYNQRTRSCGFIYESEEKAKLNTDKNKTYVATVRIEWEE